MISVLDKWLTRNNTKFSKIQIAVLIKDQIYKWNKKEEVI